ncbi:MAG: Tim44-like domain-containing protein [Gammaproteobacteria bacterium]|nr:Tim44-like domain-containing protein [Gammaproteobacteria bacterium]
MSKALLSILSLFLVATLVILPMHDAEAKRLGGGGSFGGKSTFGQKYQRSVERPKNANSTSTQAQRRGGLGSMLGGLAMGGLLAAMFMGGGFENINFFDILIFGLIAFILFKMFAARRDAMSGATDTAAGRTDMNANGMQRDAMFKAHPSEQTITSTGGIDSELVYEAPKGFNEAEFLQGANAAYEMLQQAWDDGELAEIRGLVTDKVFAEIQQQLQQRSGQNLTEIVTLHSRLLEIRTVDQQIEASVMFDCMLREIDDENIQEGQADQVREIWHFIKPVNGLQPTWHLDGIQQLQQ